MQLLSILTFVFAATSTVLCQAHAPQPGGVAKLQGRHSFMAKYPEYFERHKRQSSGTPVCKRGLQERSLHQMLDPVDVAAMLVGRGAYTQLAFSIAVERV